MYVTREGGREGGRELPYSASLLIYTKHYFIISLI
jgi:hypothetical protein